MKSDIDRHKRNSEIKTEPTGDRTTFESVVNTDPNMVSKRNENILCAVLALLKELDENGLELVKRDIDRKIGEKARSISKI